MSVYQARVDIAPRFGMGKEPHGVPIFLATCIKQSTLTKPCACRCGRQEELLLLHQSTSNCAVPLPAPFLSPSLFTSFIYGGPACLAKVVDIGLCWSCFVTALARNLEGGKLEKEGAADGPPRGASVTCALDCVLSLCPLLVQVVVAIFGVGFFIAKLYDR